MDHYKEAGKVDPDYVSYNSAVELNEEEDKKENLTKLRKILDESYTQEVVERQKQIEQIELQICKDRKLLHLLRYALIKSYYKKKELEYNGEDEAASSDNFIVPDKQNRIHPAIKKLLGKNVHNLDHLNVKDKRRSISRFVNLKAPEKTAISPPDSKRFKPDIDAVQTNDKTIRHLPSIPTHENNLDFVRSRKKTKYRIIVGNISKLMPSSEDDALTHKWMVYIRGPKDLPDVSHFIDKVVFYLHPSYKPHDVIEVRESPFHLSRRGWGEFSVKVLIFFKATLNKPVEVIHDIKLAQKFAGRPTLGKETIVDIYLYDGNNDSKETESEVDYFSDVGNEDVKLEDIDIKIEDCDFLDVAAASTEHDYCSETIDKSCENGKEMWSEHSYALHKGFPLPNPKTETIEQDETNKLIYGLDAYCHEENEKYNKQIVTTNHFKQLIRLDRKDIKFNNTQIIVFGKTMEGAFLNTFGKLIQAPPRDVTANKSFQVALPQNRMKNIGEALPYLFKRLPLCSDLATNANYKRIYPFTASSLKEYVTWNVGKRRSSEWSRARMIKKHLLAEKVQGIENWNTKAVLMYGRSHGYTPYVPYDLFNKESEEKKLLRNCYLDSAKMNFCRISPIDDEEDVTVNVDSDSEINSPKKAEPTIDITDPQTKLERCYIRQTALSCGVILRPEEIVEGVKINGAETVLLEAVKCFAENLIRRAFNHKVCTSTTSTSSPNNSAITSKNVQAAISERPELTNLQLYTSVKGSNSFP